MTESKQKHTPGPWRVSGGRWDRRLTHGNNPPLPIRICDESKAAAANAARIVECVNACDGIEDPAALVDAARRALKWAAFMAENSGEMRMPLPNGVSRVAHVAEFHRDSLKAALGGASDDD